MFDHLANAAKEKKPWEEIRTTLRRSPATFKTAECATADKQAGLNVGQKPKWICEKLKKIKQDWKKPLDHNSRSRSDRCTNLSSAWFEWFYRTLTCGGNANHTDQHTFFQPSQEWKFLVMSVDLTKQSTSLPWWSKLPVFHQSTFSLLPLHLRTRRSLTRHWHHASPHLSVFWFFFFSPSWRGSCAEKCPDEFQ